MKSRDILPMPPVPQKCGSGGADKSSLSADSPVKSHVRGAPRVVMATASAVTAVAICLAGLTGVWVCVAIFAGSVTTASVLTSPVRVHQRSQRLSLVAMLPIGLIALVALLVITGQAAALVDVSVWASRPGALLIWALVLLALLGVAAYRGGSIPIVHADVPAAVTLAGCLAAGVVTSVVLPFEVWARNVANSTDFSRHLVITKNLLSSGSLNYESESYPRGLHSLWGVVWQAGGGTAFADAWQALEAVLWVLLSLMVTGLVVIASRAARTLDLPLWVSAVGTPVLVVVTFLSGDWVSQILTWGFATTILGGLAIVTTVVCSLDDDSSVKNDSSWFGSLRCVVVLTAIIVGIANAWPILTPIPLAVLLVCLAQLVWRKPEPRVLLLAGGVLLVGLATSAPVLLSLLRLNAGDVSGALSTAGGSGMQMPQWWWYVGAILAVGTALLIVRTRTGDLGLTWLVTALASLVVVLGVAFLTESSFDQQSYYFIKALWTCAYLISPLALVGVCWTLTVAYRAGAGLDSRPVRLGLVGVASVVSVIALAAIAGQIVGTPSQLASGVQHGFGAPPLQIPALTAVESRPALRQNQSVVVWGIAPYASPDANSMSAVGFTDWFTQESLQWLEVDAIFGFYNRVLHDRDAKAMCQVLRQNPDVVRYTGPNPRPVQWLEQSGCPSSVVKIDSWIVLPIGDEWFAHLPWQGSPYSYPTWQEFQRTRQAAS